jgi:hypothetical protein
VAEKNRTKGAARLRFFGARAAEGGEAYTGLLGEVKPATKSPPWMAGGFYVSSFPKRFLCFLLLPLFLPFASVLMKHPICRQGNFLYFKGIGTMVLCEYLLKL